MTAACAEYKYHLAKIAQFGEKLQRSTGVGYEVKGHKRVNLRLKAPIVTH